MISIDEFKNKPDGTFTAQERVVFAAFGFYEVPGIQLTAPICYDAMGRYTDLLQVTGEVDRG